MTFRWVESIFLIDGLSFCVVNRSLKLLKVLTWLP